MPKKTCKCGNPARLEDQRYCLQCHAESMRKWRKSHPMTPEQRKKDSVRSYAKEYLKRGKLVKKSCQHLECKREDTQMHHPDYNKPLVVIWLCRPHHLELHQKAKQKEN